MCVCVLFAVGVVDANLSMPMNMQVYEKLKLRKREGEKLFVLG